LDTVKLFNASVSGKWFLLIAVFALLLMAPPISLSAESDTSAADNREAARDAALKYIQQAVTQYQSGAYKDCEKSLLRAQSREKHLTGSERARLSNAP